MGCLSTDGQGGSFGGCAIGSAEPSLTVGPQNAAHDCGDRELLEAQLLLSTDGPGAGPQKAGRLD